MKLLITVCCLMLIATQQLSASEAVNRQLIETVTALRQAFNTQPQDNEAIDQQLAKLSNLSSETAAAKDWRSFAQVTSVQAEVLQLKEQESAAVATLTAAIEQIEAVEETYQLIFQLANIYGATDDKTAINQLLTSLQSSNQTPPQLIQAVEQIIVSMRLNPGNPFPTFSVTDSEGAPLNLEDYKGKVVLIDFFASWCMPCRIEKPHIIQLYQQHQDEGFAVIGINFDNTREEFEAYRNEAGFTWQNYFDGNGWGNELGKKYGVRSLPQTYLLDRDGTIIASNIRGEELAHTIEAALKSPQAQ